MDFDVIHGKISYFCFGRKIREIDGSLGNFSACRHDLAGFFDIIILSNFNDFIRQKDGF